MRPIVGITTDLQLTIFGAWEEESALVPQDYVRAVERASAGLGLTRGLGSPVILRSERRDPNAEI